MNANRILNLTTPALTALLVAASAAPAQSVARSQAAAHSQSSSRSQAAAQGQSGASSNSGGKMTVVSRESVNGDDGDQSVIEVRIDNGKVSVRRNGQEVPDAQIRRQDDGRIVIVDENGNQLDNVQLFAGVGGNGQGLGGQGMRGFEFRAGDGQNDPFWGAADEGPAPKVMLGIHMGEPGPALEKHLGLEPGKSCMITGVFEGLPAFEAGLGEYDVIIDVDGQPAGGSGSIRKVLTDKQPGDVLVLRVIQAGKQKDIRIKLQPFDAEQMHAAKLIGEDAADNMWRGMPDMGDMKFDLGDMNIPGLQGRILVAPQLDQLKQEWANIQPKLQGIEPKIAELQPLIERYMHDAMQKHGQAGIAVAPPAAGKDVDAKLDQLDQRLAQLEGLLQKLVEKQLKQ